MRTPLGLLVGLLMLPLTLTAEPEPQDVVTQGPKMTAARVAWVACVREASASYKGTEQATQRAKAAVRFCRPKRDAMAAALREDNTGTVRSPTFMASFARSYVEGLEERATAIVTDSLMRGASAPQ